MQRFLTILLCLTLFWPQAEAGKRKNAANTIPQPFYQEPDALMPALQPQRPLARVHEVVVRKRRHTTGKHGIDVSHYRGMRLQDNAAAARSKHKVFSKYF